MTYILYLHPPKKSTPTTANHNKTKLLKLAIQGVNVKLI